MKKWIQRQINDPYIRQARLECYRCRSAFKLIQLNNMVSGKLFQPGHIVVDLGAAPGSWSQVASKFVNVHSSTNTLTNESSFAQTNGLVIAFDKDPFIDIPGVICHPNINLLKHWEQSVKLIKESVENHFILNKINASNDGVDVVLSDMAPNATGISDLDIPHIMDLAHCVLNVRWFIKILISLF